MIKKIGDFIEIEPSVMMGINREVCSINLSERKISIVHLRDPRSSNHKKILDSLKRMYGQAPQCMVLEITTTPTEKSTSTKTITNEILYFNGIDMNNDYSKITSHIYKGEAF